MHRLLYSAATSGVGTTNIKFANKREALAATKLSMNAEFGCWLHFYQPVNSEMLVMVYCAEIQDALVIAKVNEKHERTDANEERRIRRDPLKVLLNQFEARKIIRDRAGL
jgi:predicted AAA+ superfamily ATPase